MGLIGDGLNWVGDQLGLGPNTGTAPQYGSHYQVPDFQHQYRRYGQLGQQFAGRQAPQANAYTGNYSGFRQNQQSLGRQLAAEARGQGIGQQTVRMQAQDMADRTAAQQMAMAASARPGQGAGAYQNAAFNTGNAQSAVGGQAALAGAQMQLGAMNQYGGFLQGARSADEQMNMFNAGQRQQGSQFNTDAQLRMYGLNDQAQMEALRQRLQLAGMQQQGGLAYEQNAAQYNLARMGQPTAGQALLGMAGGAAGAYFGRAGSMGGGAPGQAPANPYGTSPLGYNPYDYGF